MGTVLTKEQLEVRTEAMDPELVALWDAYAQAGYGDVHKLPCFHRMDKVLEGLFVRTLGARVLDAGCGDGSFFLPILRSIFPAFLLGVDWSDEMLEGAERKSRELLEGASRKAKKLLKKWSGSLFQIDLEQVDLSRDFPWSDDSFGTVVSHMTTCFIARAWQEVLAEIHRVTKKGGYIYITTFLADWDFPKIVKRHSLGQFLRSPQSIYYIPRLKKHPAGITEIAKEKGLTYPSKEGVTAFFMERGATEVVQQDVFWGAGVAVRVRV